MINDKLNYDNKKIKEIIKIKKIFEYHNGKDKNMIFCYDECDIKFIINKKYNNKSDLFNALKIIINKLTKIHKYFHNKVVKYQKKLCDAKNNNAKFAWVKRIGHAIMDTIEIQIGGTTIDKHYCGWLNIWYELTANRSMESIYFELIGNVPILTTYDRVTKPKYILRVPLQFWFCRYSGCALPLVALEYHDVSLHIKFKQFMELCYMEKGCDVICDKAYDINNLDAVLFIDYIYLDDSERRKFAQYNHEYLIDQLQVLEQCSIVQKYLQIDLNNFIHPSKELIWVPKTKFHC